MNDRFRCFSGNDCALAKEGIEYLEKQKWYWPGLTETGTKQLLESVGEGYLVRDSSAPDCLLVLVMKKHGQIENYRLKCQGSRWFPNFRKVPPHLLFESLHALLDYFLSVYPLVPICHSSEAKIRCVEAHQCGNGCETGRCHR